MQEVRSILIPDGEDELALRVLRCFAEAPHLKISVLSRDREAPIRLSRHHHRFLTHEVDGFNHERVQVTKEAAKQVGADIIFPTGLPGIRAVAEHKQELASVAQLPPLPSTEALDAFADKLSFAEILDREGIPYPKIHRLLDGRLEEAQVADIRFPVLVKPRNLQAGNGIRMCETSSQVVEYLANQRDPSDFFVQEFVSGTDMTCSVFSNDGKILAHTIQRVILRSHKPFHPSAAVEFVHDEGVLNLIQKLIGAVRWSGIVSFDLVLDEETNEAKVLEANPRYWRSLLGSLMAGVNFPYVASLASEGRTISRTAYRNVRYAKPDVVATLMVKSLCGRPSRMSGVAVGSLQYLLRDPLPDVSIQLSRLREYFR